MFLVLRDVLSTQAAAELCSALQQGNKGEGDAILQGLWSHPLFLLCIQPHSFSQVAFNRYEAGQGSTDPIVAEAIVGGPGGIRADLCVRVFLSDESSYEGGELVVDIGYGEERRRGYAGTCIAFPASARQGISPVTRGTLWTAELWVQSRVRSSSQREILYDIGHTFHLLELFAQDRGIDAERLRVCHRNLLRLWVDT